MDAVVFPGQGSQKEGMGRPWAGSTSWRVVSDVSDVLGRDVAAHRREADAATLQETPNAPVAAFALGLVRNHAAREAGLEWGAAGGHSLGEYTALVAAGAVDVAAATHLVGERAEAMQTATDMADGVMTAVIGLDADAVAECCARGAGEAWLANDNAPGQIVVAGTPTGVGAASAEAKARGGRAIALAVGGAFHTPLMEPAQGRLDAALHATELRASEVPVVANVDALAHHAADDWAGLLSRQLCNPVRWRESVLALRDLGVTRIVELGPGGVLSGMVKRITGDVEVRTIGAPDDLT
ncbi:MAG: ACP S-malonyltransferase [Acidimicrobiales bacterium]